MGELTELVYLVDDEAPILKALGRLLKANGFETRSFLRAGAFLEAYDPQHPACLILDLEPPDSSGLELQCTLRERGSTHPVSHAWIGGEIPMDRFMSLPGATPAELSAAGLKPVDLIQR